MVYVGRESCKLQNAPNVCQVKSIGGELHRVKTGCSLLEIAGTAVVLRDIISSIFTNNNSETSF